MLLEDKVAIRYYFDANAYLNAGGVLSDLQLVVVYSGKTVVLSGNTFKQDSRGWYYADLDTLAAKEMRVVWRATFYNAYGEAGESIVGETMTYSIESYAYSKQSDANEKMANMVKAMMLYGDSAYAYMNR